MNLLAKTRQINAMLQRGKGTVEFKEMAVLLSNVIEANIFIVSKTGKLLGFAIAQKIENERLKQMLEDQQFPLSYTESLTELKETTANLGVDSEYTAFPIENKELFADGLTTIVPIIGSGKRIGTLILSRIGQEFNNDDILLAEYSSTVVGMEILHELAEEIAEEARSQAIVQMAISSLSYSELDAIKHVFDELDGTEGILIASKIADRVGITRSVIVNALRKLESASVIDSRSLGMKGTFINVKNDKFLNELEKAAI